MADKRELKPKEIRADDRMEDELREARTPLDDMNIPQRPISPRADDPYNVALESAVGEVGDVGPTGGVGLPEVATDEELRKERGGDHGRDSLPSDMRDIGDPEGSDVGIPGGLASGGEMGEGGRGHDPDEGDEWGSDLQPSHRRDDRGQAAAMGGTGVPENAAAREDRVAEEEESDRYRRAPRR